MKKYVQIPEEIIYSGSAQDLYSFLSESINVSSSVSTASYALTASFLAGSIESSSYSFTSSFSETSSYVNDLTQSLGIFGNVTQTGSLNILGDIFVEGTITASTLYVINITSSNQYLTGSTIFGDDVDFDEHQITGSLLVTGSTFTWNDSQVVTISQTSSIFVNSSSYSVTSSYSETGSYSLTASYIETSTISGSITGSAGSIEEFLEIVVNGNIRRIPLYSTVV